MPDLGGCNAPGCERPATRLWKWAGTADVGLCSSHLAGIKRRMRSEDYRGCVVCGLPWDLLSFTDSPWGHYSLDICKDCADHLQGVFV
jgi:hypothetical protein